MFSLNRIKRTCALVFVAASFAAVYTGIAAAASNNQNGVVLDAPKTVAVDYNHGYDQLGNPLPCVAPSGTITNNTTFMMSCEVYVVELDKFVVPNSTLAPGTSSIWSFTAQVLPGMKSLTLNMACNGTGVPGSIQKVRILFSS
jgi:hypothetical protein